MKCYLFTRTERVVYVVGVNAPGNAGATFADALVDNRAKVFRSDDKAKPFTSLTRDKNVMYIERIGMVPVHLSTQELVERANRRVRELNIEHADNNVEDA